VHLDLLLTVALARLAAAARLVEAETLRLVAAYLGVGHRGIQAADFVEDLDIRGRVGARRPTDRRLIDGNQLVDLLRPGDAIVGNTRSRHRDVVKFFFAVAVFFFLPAA